MSTTIALRPGRPGPGAVGCPAADAGWWLCDHPAGWSEHNRPAAARRWLCRHGTIQRGSALLRRAADRADCAMRASSILPPETFFEAAQQPVAWLLTAQRLAGADTFDKPGARCAGSVATG
jgi:hypothetical protein